jgi:hypothetical protein
MVDELDAWIFRLFDGKLPKSILKTPISISFAAPSKEFPPASLALPAVNFFLYDLRLNVDKRRNDLVMERLPNGSLRRTPAPLPMDASYLVSVWTDEKSPKAETEEHRIFGAILQVLLATSTFSADDLRDPMKDLSPPPVCRVSAGSLLDPSQTWQALGGRQKLSTTWTVTFQLPVPKYDDVPLVTDKRVSVALWDGHDNTKGEVGRKKELIETSRRQVAILGTVFNSSGEPASALAVSLADSTGLTQLSALSHDDGTYFFCDLPDGSYTVSASWAKAGARKTAAVSRDKDGNVAVAKVDLKLVEDYSSA